MNGVKRKIGIILIVQLLFITLTLYGCGKPEAPVQKSGVEKEELKSEAIDSKTAEPKITDSPKTDAEEPNVVPQNAVSDNTNQDGPAKQPEFRKLNLKDIPGIGQLHTYQFGNNLIVEPNLNMDLSIIAAAVGSGFKHKGYPIESNHSELNRVTRDYFTKYIGNSTAKEIYKLETADGYSGADNKYRGKVYLAMLRTGEFLKGNMLYPDKKFFVGSLFKNGDVNLDELNKMLNKFAQETNAADFIKGNINLYNTMVDDFINGTLDFNVVQRIQDFYGVDLSTKQFKIILTTMEKGGSAINVGDDYSSQNRTYYIIMDPLGTKEYVLNNIYHETAHDFYSAILDSRNNTSGSKGLENLIKQYSDYKNTLGYYTPEDDFEHRLNETLARVVTVAMLEKYHGKEIAMENLNKEMKLGWKRLDKIYNLVKEQYLPKREQYKTFGDFVPVILDYIKSIS